MQISKLKYIDNLFKERANYLNNCLSLGEKPEKDP